MAERSFWLMVGVPAIAGSFARVNKDLLLHQVLRFYYGVPFSKPQTWQGKWLTMRFKLNLSELTALKLIKKELNLPMRRLPLPLLGCLRQALPLRKAQEVIPLLCEPTLFLTKSLVETSSPYPYQRVKTLWKPIKGVDALEKEIHFITTLKHLHQAFAVRACLL